MNKKQLFSTTFAAILATGMMTTGATSAFAKEQAAVAPAATKEQNKQVESDKKITQAEKDLVKVSRDAMLSMRDLNNARWAIFNGDTDQARTFVDAAVTRIDVTEKESKKYALDIKAPKEDDNYVPFDVSLTELDAFAPTAKKAKHTAVGKHHGTNKKDEETLKLSEIDISLSTGMIPVDFAKKYINEASSLIKKGLFYEANLALKAVDDAVLVQSFALEDVPRVKNEQTKGDNKKTG